MNKPEKDIFNTRWVIIGVVVASLVMPILSSCGTKGNLKHPTPTTVEHPDPTTDK